jgi:tRNA threonylcarbamoyladenosine biosynthesis protein TsaB
MEDLGVDQADAASFAFCEGPGSLLGIRTTAMVLRTWLSLAPRPVYAFQSLPLVACALGERDVNVIADARRDAWHCTRVDAAGSIQPLRRIPTADLSGRLLMPDHFRHWSALPHAQVERVPYDLSSLLSKAAGVDLFRATDEPDAYLHEEPSYVTWTPKVHQAPAAS